MKYPPPEELPDTARLDHYLKYIKLESVSDVIAAHLAYEIVPIFDSEYAFLHPFMEGARDIYKILCNAAENNKIVSLKFENGQFKAPLLNWIQFLVETHYPLADIVLKIYEANISMIRKSVKYKNLDKKKNAIEPIGKNREKLEKELMRLDKNFPKSPYWHYYFYPTIKNLLIGENLDLASFVSIASGLIPRSRAAGRPRREHLDMYAKAHPELREWFDEIKSQKK